MKSFVRRYRWFIVALSVIILLILAREIAEGVLPTEETRAFTLADYEKIELGMTEKEVIEALGPPVGNYVPQAMVYVGPWPRPASTLEQWVSETGVIWVFFDKEGKAWSKQFRKPMPSKESFFQRLLRKLGLK